MRVVNLSKAFVPSGKKVANETVPLVMLTSSYNGFKLNNKACALLGVDTGDNVLMFDAWDKDDIPASQNERYLIGAAEGLETGETDKDGQPLIAGAILGKTKGFNYSFIYGSMLNGDPEVQVASFDYLKSKGAMTITEGGSKVSTTTMTAELVPYQDEPVEIDEEGNTRMLYILTNFVTKDHSVGNDDEEEVDVDAVEDLEDVGDELDEVDE